MDGDYYSGLYQPQTNSYLQYRPTNRPDPTFFDDTRTVEVGRLLGPKFH